MTDTTCSFFICALSSRQLFSLDGFGHTGKEVGFEIGCGCGWEGGMCSNQCLTSAQESRGEVAV